MPKLNTHHIIISKLTDLLYTRKQLTVSVLRLDLIHPVISGNKWFKLKYYIEKARAEKKTTIITFGGAYSNHIIATAAACKLYGLAAIGIIRGKEAPALSHTLQEAKTYGMKLVFITREEYANKKIPDGIIDANSLLIAEGGYGKYGVRGASDIRNFIQTNAYSHICCAVGTGTMMAGLLQSAEPDQQVIGIPVLKNNFSLNKAITDILENKKQPIQLIHDYHFGGYAKYQPALITYMNDFFQQSGIPTDFVYTGKLFYAVNDLIKKDHFPAGSNILIIHSGGLQGNLSLQKGILIF